VLSQMLLDQPPRNSVGKVVRADLTRIEEAADA
jgi:hypothetical protein